MPPRIATFKLLAAALVFATSMLTADANADAPASSAGMAGPNPGRMGHVLLSNGNVLYGSITKLGDQVVVKRNDSSSVRLPSSRVRFVSESLDGLYRFRVAHRFPSDLAQLQRDIQWSLRHGLTMRAAEDVMKARELAPSDVKTIQLLSQVAAELKKPHQRKSSPTRESADVPGNQSAVQTVSYETIAAGSIDATLPETQSDRQLKRDSEDARLDQSIANHFSARVQPILMNRCVACHADSPENKTSLRLRTAIESTWAPKQVTRDNLQAVLQFIDRQSPLDSPLRSKAMDGHGGVKKSFGAPGSAMLRNLDRWLISLQDSELRELPELGPAPRTVLSLPQFAAEANRTERAPDENASMENDPEATGSEIRRMPKVSNPFDPEIFNRRFGRAD